MLTLGPDQMLNKHFKRHHPCATCAVAIARMQDGVRPLPIDIQARAFSRLREVPTEFSDAVRVSARSYAGTGDDLSYSAGDEDDSSATSWDRMSNDSDGGYGADQSESESEDESESAWGGGQAGRSSSRLGGVGSMRGADKLVAEEAGVAQKELLPMLRRFTGLQDRERMAMLLELLTEYTPIRVSACGCGEGVCG